MESLIKKAKRSAENNGKEVKLPMTKEAVVKYLFENEIIKANDFAIKALCLSAEFGEDIPIHEIIFEDNLKTVKVVYIRRFQANHKKKKKSTKVWVILNIKEVLKNSCAYRNSCSDEGTFLEVKREDYLQHMIISILKRCGERENKAGFKEYKKHDTYTGKELIRLTKRAWDGFNLPEMVSRLIISFLPQIYLREFKKRIIKECIKWLCV